MKKREKDNTQGKQYGFFTVSLAFFSISFLGWAYETLLMLLLHGKWYDRGFLFLPFCPIYGFPVCTLYLLFGTPTQGRFANWLQKLCRTWRKVWQGVLRYFLYFLLAGVYATLIELAVGLFTEAVGLSLWSYASEPFNLRGHVCLQVSLFWGFALTLFMRVAFPPLIKLLAKLRPKPSVVLGVVLGSALLVDFLFNAFSYFLTK